MGLKDRFAEAAKAPEPKAPETQPAGEPGILDQAGSAIKSALTPSPETLERLTSPFGVLGPSPARKSDDSQTIRSAANGVSFGALPWALKKTGATDPDTGQPVDWTKTYDAAEKEHPAANLAGAVFSPNPLGKEKAAATILGKLGRGAASGAAFGAAQGGGSALSHDKGLADAAKDIAMGAGAGAGVGGALGAAAGGASKLAALFPRAKEAALALVDKAAAAETGPLAGSKGKAFQEASLGMKDLAAAAADESLPKELRDRISSKLATERAAALRAKLAENKLAALDSHEGAIDRASQALTDAQAKFTPEARQVLAAERLAQKPMTSRVTSIAKDMALPAAGAFLGHLLGGHEAAGLGVGTLATSLMKPGRRLANAARDPAFYGPVLGRLGGAAQPALESSIGPASSAAGSLMSREEPTESSTPSSLENYARLLREEDQKGTP